MNGHKYQSRLNQKFKEGSVQDISSHFDRSVALVEMNVTRHVYTNASRLMYIDFSFNLYRAVSR